VPPDLESAEIREDAGPLGTGPSPGSHRRQIWIPRPLCNSLDPFSPPVNKPLFVVDRVFGRESKFAKESNSILVVPGFGRYGFKMLW
jgi:hypothetical protein